MNIDDLKKRLPYDEIEQRYSNCYLANERVRGYNEAIDYLASRGYLPSVKMIEGLDGAIENLENNVCGRGHLNDYDDNSFDIVIKAARAYAKLQDGEIQQPADAVVSDDDIDAVWGNANFGANTDKREIILDTLFKYARGFSTGSTATHICQDLGLIKNYRTGDDIVWTEKGEQYIRAIATLDRLSAPVGVPDGYKLVPIEPTSYQLICGQNAMNDEDKDLSDFYKAMISAAPTPEQTEIDLDDVTMIAWEAFFSSNKPAPYNQMKDAMQHLAATGRLKV